MSISGTLADMSIYELLQMPVRERKSGSLMIHSQSEKAELTYQNGELIHAEYNDLLGEEAVYPLLTWEQGNFDLGFHPVSKLANIHLKLENIIIEGVRRLSEYKKQTSQEKLDEALIPNLEQALSEKMEQEEGLKQIALGTQAESTLIACYHKPHLNRQEVESIREQIQLIQGYWENSKENFLDYMLVKTKNYVVVGHALKKRAGLFAAFDDQIPLGQIFLILRRLVEEFNLIINRN